MTHWRLGSECCDWPEGFSLHRVVSSGRSSDGGEMKSLQGAVDRFVAIQKTNANITQPCKICDNRATAGSPRLLVERALNQISGAGVCHESFNLPKALVIALTLREPPRKDDVPGNVSATAV